MFDEIVKNYEKQKKQIEKDHENLKKNLKTLQEPLTKEKVAILNANQQIIEKETVALKTELNKFYKESQNWIKMYDDLNESLKQLGDVVNWAYTIEAELQDYLEKNNEKKEK